MRLPALGLQGKLLVAFGAVLVPVLVLLLLGYRGALAERKAGILQEQLVAAQAIAFQVDAAFEGALGAAWAVAEHPGVRALDPTVGPALASIAAGQPGRVSIDLYDRGGSRVAGSGAARGAGSDGASEAAWFRRTMATNSPTVSDVRRLRGGEIGLVAAVPVRGPDDEPVGVLAVELPAAELAAHYDESRVGAGQAILLADGRGRAAFTTLERDLRYDAAARFSVVPELRAALAGVPVAAPVEELPFARGPQLAAFVPTPRYGWAVGVTTPSEVALAPAVLALRRNLVLFGVVVLASMLFARLLSRALVAPVRRLEEGARAIGAGDLSRRVRIRSGDELQRLGETFDDMAAGLERRQAEIEGLRAEAEHRARQLAAVIESMSDAVFVRSADGGSFTFNPAGRALLGLVIGDEGRVSLRSRFDLRDADGRPQARAENPMRRALAGETFAGVPLRLHRKDGAEVLLEASGSPVRDEAGQVVLGVVVARDVTRERQAQAEGAAVARITQALVREIELERVAAVAVERGAEVLEVEAAALYRADEERRELLLVAHRGLDEDGVARLRHVPFDAPLPGARAAREGRTVVEQDLSAAADPATAGLARRVGARASVSLPLRAHGRLLGVVTFVRRRAHSFSPEDLAFLDTVADLFAVAIDKANLYEEVRDALRVREEFMAAAAHELRTPVTTIRTWAQVLLRREPGPETQHHALAAIERQTDRIARLIDGLLLGLRLRTGADAEVRRTPVDLADVIDRVVASPALAPLAGRLRVEVDRPLPVALDVDLVSRALGDALEDAARQTPAGDLIELRAVRLLDEARVGIRFPGAPIDPSRRGQYFEPLFEPVPPGEPGYVGRVSVGPYLNKLVVEAHQGRVWIETDSGATTLWASLPLVTATAA